MRFDVIVVGGGTAGCVLAARLSEDPSRQVCLLEAGPDYGPLAEGRWPQEILDARALPESHSWGRGGEDERPLGGRILGGSSAVNACMVLAGSPADYDEWGKGWTYDDLLPHLERAKERLRTASAATDDPTPFQIAFVDAAQEAGFPLLVDPSDPAVPVGVAPSPRNVVSGTRWNAALAYLEDARSRPNLSIVAESLVDRVLLEGSRARGVVTADGRIVEAETVVLTAGAYFSPAILSRSGIGPSGELRRHGIDVVQDLPVGERLLDHYGVDVALEPSTELEAATAARAGAGGPFEAHAVVKAASSHCAPGSWDLHLLPWISARPDGGYQVSVIVFHMKPLSAGRLRLRSTNPDDLPEIERGFLARDDDLDVLREGIELARSITRAEPLGSLIARELSPGDADLGGYIRASVRNYFHPAGTCAIGQVVGRDCRVLGSEGLLVADASVMPTIPRANTNLTTAAIAERVAATFR